MAKIEVCRIVAGWDTRQEENRWREARLITYQSEKVIKQVKYRDKRYRSGFLAIRSIIFNDIFGGYKKNQDDQKKSQILEDCAHAKLIEEMIQDGWEPAGNDEHGSINMMKRTRSE
jgi:hypothetical protein